MKIDIVSAAPKTILGESPLWHRPTNSLIFIDILGKTVHNFYPKTGATQSMVFDQLVGFAVPTNHSRKDRLILFVGLENKIVEVDLGNQRILREVLEVPPKYYTRGMRFNDAKCSADGELYAGYMSRQWREGKEGFLFKVMQGHLPSVGNGAAPLVSVLKDVLPREGIAMPNGSAWMGNEFMFIVDSAAAEISRLEFAQMDGVTGKRVVDRRCVYKLPEVSISAGYVMDGITIDNKGKLWVALTGAGCILRVDPATGQEVFRLHLDAKKPTSCTFGGPDLTEMYITTRNEQATDEVPSADLIVAIIDGVRGAEPAVQMNSDMISVLDQEPQESSCNFLFCGGLF